MLPNAMRLCDAKFGNLFLYGGTRSVSLPSATRRPPTLSDGAKTLCSGSMTIRTIHSPVSSSTGRRRQHCRPRGGAGLLEARSSRFVRPRGGRRRSTPHLLVPMLKEGKLIGALSIYHQQVRPFTDKQIELVQELRRPGRDRRRKRPPLQRAAQIAAAADRHRRCAQGDQPLDCSICRPCLIRWWRSAARICEADMGLHRSSRRGRISARRQATAICPSEFADACDTAAIAGRPSER